MSLYVTFFNVGKDSEALVVDRLGREEEVIRWPSEQAYFGARTDEPRPIDGGVYTYGLALGVAAGVVDDTYFEGRIVSFRPSEALLAMLEVLDSVVTGLRRCEWPEWRELGEE